MNGSRPTFGAAATDCCSKPHFTFHYYCSYYRQRWVLWSSVAPLQPVCWIRPPCRPKDTDKRNKSENAASLSLLLLFFCNHFCFCVPAIRVPCVSLFSSVDILTLRCVSLVSCFCSSLSVSPWLSAISLLFFLLCCPSLRFVPLPSLPFHSIFCSFVCLGACVFGLLFLPISISLCLCLSCLSVPLSLCFCLYFSMPLSLPCLSSPSICLSLVLSPFSRSLF